MAIINKKSGFYGYTIDTSGDISDINGTTDKCIISVTYNSQVTDIDVTVSSGEEDWAILTGDGRTIPVTNPQVLFVNRGNTLIEFTLSERYPANAPCFLVFRSDSAYINTRERVGTRPFEVNAMTGFFGFTVDNGKNDLQHGLTDLMQVTLLFPIQTNEVDFIISEDASHWGIRVGDGSIIGLSHPEVLFINQDNAVVQFKLERPYPSNTPVILVYRSDKAYIQILTRDEDVEFIPVTDIKNIPTEIFMNDTLDLSQAIIIPSNASVQFLRWELIGSVGTLENNKLTVPQTGQIQIKGSIVDNEDIHYTKTFDILVKKDVVRINNQLPVNIEIMKNETSETLYINAISENGVELTYQWYSIIHDVETIIPDAKDSKYLIPNNEVGNYKYICKVKSKFSDVVISNQCSVIVDEIVNEISFVNPPISLRISEDYTFRLSPENLNKSRLVWSASNQAISTITQDGKVSLFGLGKTTISATYYGKGYQRTVSKEFDVLPYIRVTDITGLPTEIETNTDLQLSCNILPTEASSRPVEWYIVDRGGTEGTLSGNILRTRNEGIITLKCVVKKGYTISSDFVKEFQIKSIKPFIPVTDITMISTNEEIMDNIIQNFTFNIIPDISTNKFISYELLGSDDKLIYDGNRLNVLFKNPGMKTIRVTIKNGLTPNSDYVKEFQINVIKQFIRVEDVQLTNSIFEDVKVPLKLESIINPSNSTNKTIQYSIVSNANINVRINSSNELIIDENNKWWLFNKETLNIEERWTKAFTDPIIIEVKIVNGLSENTDYKKNVNITYVYPDKPSAFINVQDIQLNILDTNMDRAFMPIPLNEFKITPIDSTNKELSFNIKRNQNQKDIGDKYEVVNKDNITIPSFIANNYITPYEYDDKFLYFKDSGKFDIEVIVSEGIEDNNQYRDFKKKITVDIKKPFINTKNFEIGTVDIYYPSNENFIFFNLDYLFDNINLNNDYITNNIESRDDIYKSTQNTVVINEIKILGIDITNKNKVSQSILVLDKNMLNKELIIDINIPYSISDGVKYSKIEFDKFFSHHLLTLKILKDDNTDIYGFVNTIDRAEFIYTLDQTPHGSEYLKKYNVDYSLKTLTGEVVSGINSVLELNDDMGSDVCTYIDDTLTLFRDEEVRLKLKVNNINPNVLLYEEVIVLESNQTENVINKQYPNSRLNINYNEFLIKLKLKNDQYVLIKNICDISRLSNSLADTTTVTIGELEFKKSDIVEVEFWNDKTDLKVPTSLKDFGTNFTSLIKISKIPKSITGKNCLMNFLTNCTSFNSPITIPVNVNGEKALFGFLSGCTNFNSNITFESTTLEGDGILGYFLNDCTKFNKSIYLPTNSIKGKFALLNFMKNCISFNNTISFPLEMSGDRCLEFALNGCISFNQQFQLPSLSEENDKQLHGFMFNNINFISDITINHSINVKNFNKFSFGIYNLNTPNIQNGMYLIGTGGSDIINTLQNNIDGDFPLRNLKTR